MNSGFSSVFLNDRVVELPILCAAQKADLFKSEQAKNGKLDYGNYSVFLSKSRRLPLFAASNIDGRSFKKIKRSGNWKKDGRAKDAQFGAELYTARKAEFDRGHMVKREDVQWGTSKASALKSAKSTFFYSNAAPQHAKLNRKIWKKLEDYILHTETTQDNLKVCVFTGPVLDENDPEFVTPIAGKKIQIPTLFWKLVYYQKSDSTLNCVAFLMSQASLLIKSGVVGITRYELESTSKDNKMFMQFEKAATYQVNLATIEKLTKLKFPKAVQSYRDKRPLNLILEKVDVTLEKFSQKKGKILNFKIGNIKL